MLTLPEECGHHIATYLDHHQDVWSCFSLLERDKGRSLYDRFYSLSPFMVSSPDQIPFLSQHPHLVPLFLHHLEIDVSCAQHVCEMATLFSKSQGVVLDLPFLWHQFGLLSAVKLSRQFQHIRLYVLPPKTCILFCYSHVLFNVFDSSASSSWKTIHYTIDLCRHRFLWNEGILRRPPFYNIPYTTKVTIRTTPEQSSTYNLSGIEAWLGTKVSLDIKKE